MTKEQWDELMDRCLERVTKDTPEDIMLRASFQHSKTYDSPPVASMEWLDICRGELKAMLAALCLSGYAITRVDS